MQKLMALILIMLCGNCYSWSDCDMKSAPIYVDEISFDHISVYDSRTAVLNKVEKPNWLGYAHSSGGPNWNINTVSSKPLVEDIAQVFRSKKGFIQGATGNVGKIDNATIKDYILKNKFKKFLSIEIRTLEIDKVFNAKYDYNIGFELYDSTGLVTDSAQVIGSRIVPHYDFETIFPKLIGSQLSEGINKVAGKPLKNWNMLVGLNDSLIPINDGKKDLAIMDGGWGTFGKALGIVGMVVGLASVILMASIAIGK